MDKSVTCVELRHDCVLEDSKILRNITLIAALKKLWRCESVFYHYRNSFMNVFLSLIAHSLFYSIYS